MHPFTPSVNRPVILSAVRTGIGRIGGALAAVRPDDLAALAIRAAVERSAVDPHEIEEVVLGCANQAGEDNRNVARMAALLAQLPDHVAGVTVNRLCASGLSAVNYAARALQTGAGEVYVAGGVESMTRAPYSLPKGSKPFANGNVTAFDTTLGWRYPNPAMAAIFPLEAMGETAENIVERSAQGSYGATITREMQDAFALESHRRAAAAMSAHRFSAEIVPVPLPGSAIFDTDESPRVRKTDDGYEVDTSLEQLGKLRPAFRAGGSVTAGNSSSLNDGACALVMATEEYAERVGIEPLARWTMSAVAGVDPQVMGTGPVPATRKVLQRSGLSLDDIDLVELNEAFAAQSLAVVNELGLDMTKTNVNGGAIALGHPLGCSGARIVTTLVHELRRRANLGQNVRYGLATLCVGVGQGESTIIELV
jgi:acetyl-CoA acetyltransferase family protein